MFCFVCRAPTGAQVIRGLRSRKGPGGWARICVPCAIRFDLDGVLLSTSSDRSLAELWYAHRRGKDPSA